MKFVLVLISCLFWQKTAGYSLMCSDQVTLTLDAADQAALNLDAPDQLRFSVGTNPLTNFVTGPCAVSGAGAITFDVTACEGTFVRNAGSTFTYTFTLWKIVQAGDFTGGIARYRASCLSFTCTYPELATVSLAVMPTVGKDTFSTEAAGAFSLTMGRFAGTALTAAASGEIIVPEEIYIKVEMTITAAATLRLDLTRCVVTKTTDPTSTPLYVVIDDHCPDRSSGVSSDRTLINNQDDTFAGFNFKSFVFTEDLTAVGAVTYYVHCSAEVCDTSEMDDCAPAETCPAKKKKRSISESALDAKSQRKQHLVSTTVQVRLPESCEKDNGGCDRDCSMIGGTAKCSCLEGEILAANGKHCVELVEDETLLLQTTDTSSYHYMTGMVALCVAVLVMAGVLFFKSNARSSEKGSARFQAA